MSVKAAFSPKGTRIIGTLEHLEARADIRAIWREETPDDKGGKEWVTGLEFTGNTEVMWNSQRTQDRDGKALFLDEEGDEWAEDELTFREVEE